MGKPLENSVLTAPWQSSPEPSITLTTDFEVDWEEIEDDDEFIAVFKFKDEMLLAWNISEENLTFLDSWWKALSEAEIENFHFHDLRHTFATDMITGGARDFTVQAALGHANIKTTGIYAHIQNDYLRAALEMVSEKNKH